MKKLLAIAMTVLMLVLCMTVIASADEAKPVTVKVNDLQVPCGSYGQTATIIDGRTLVPLRAIFEFLGATVEWDQATKTSTSTLDDVTVSLTLGSNVMKVNGEDKTLDVAAQVINDRTLVPARAIAEAFGAVVGWDAATRTVLITMEDLDMPEILFEGDADTIDLSLGIAHGDPNSSDIAIVENPLDPSDKVFYVTSNKGEAETWSYLWFGEAYWEPGVTYLVSFNVMLDADAVTGQPIPEGKEVSIGTNILWDAHYGAYTLKITEGSGVWKNCTFAFTVPEDAFVYRYGGGVYADPVEVPGYSTKIGMNFYVDDIMIREYVGPDFARTNQESSKLQYGSGVTLDGADFGFASK